MNYTPAESRYATMRYNRCGRSGLKLPAISLGLWHTFGDVDDFNHHRPAPDTPLEETMGALDYIVRSGKALYAAVSNYKPSEMQLAISMLRALGTPCLIHQTKYSMFERWIEDGLLELLAAEG